MYIHSYIHMHTYVTYTRTTYRHVSIHTCPTARLQRAALAGLIDMRCITPLIAMRCMWQVA